VKEALVVIAILLRPMGGRHDALNLPISRSVAGQSARAAV